MNKRVFQCILLVLLIGILSCSEYPKQTEPFECVLEGEVKGWPECSSLVLIEAEKREEAVPAVSIPVVDGKFEYTFRDSVNRLYQLYGKFDEGNRRRRAEFISEKGKLFIELLRDEERLVSQIRTDLPFNKELQLVADSSIEVKLFARRKQMKADGLYYLSEENKELSEAAKQLEGEIFFSQKPERERLFEYVRTYPTFTGFCLYKWLLSKNIGPFLSFPSDPNIQVLKEIYETVYKEKYTDHPYQKEIKDMLGSLEVKEGASFVDFIAPDLDGYQHRLSDLIKGKYVLLDLWASWCGPCRSYSKDMIPVYEKYKNRGFTVVGIAREVNNTEAMRRAVEKDGYPWINLVDLNDRVGVWTKYGVLSAGRRLLIDSTGKILALDPRSEEVEKLLEEHLNQTL